MGFVHKKLHDLIQNSDPLKLIPIQYSNMLSDYSLSLFWNLKVEFLKGFSNPYLQIQVNEKGSKTKLGKSSYKSNVFM